MLKQQPCTQTGGTLTGAGTLNVGAGTATGAITLTANITRAATTAVNLTTAANNSIAFGTFSLNSPTLKGFAEIETRLADIGAHRAAEARLRKNPECHN